MCSLVTSTRWRRVRCWTYVECPTWIRGLVWLSGRDIQRDTIQHIKDAGYVDGYRTLHPDDKGYTFPVWDPHLRLDYMFVPQPFADRLQSCKVLNDPDAAKASTIFHY